MTPVVRQRLLHGLLHLLVLGVAASFVLAAAQGSFWYSTFTDRDLARAATWWDDPPTSGAELSGGPGGRVPGPALGLVFALPRIFSADPHVLFVVQVAAFSAALLVLHRGVSRQVGVVAGAMAALVWAGSPSQRATLETLWNPGFVPLCSAVALASAVHVVATRRPGGLVPFTAATAVGAQLHLGALGASLVLVPGLLLSRPAWTRRTLLAAAGAALLLYAPYLVDEALHGWENTRRLLDNDAVARSEGFEPRRVLTALGMFSGALDGWGDWPGIPRGASVTLLGAVPFVVGAVSALTLGWARRRELLAEGAGRERVVALCAIAVVLGALSLGFRVSPAMQERYVVPFVPAAAVLVGVGVQALVDAGWHGPRLFALACVVGLALFGGMPPTFVHGTWRSYDGVIATIADVRERTGWSLADLAGRTSWRAVDGQLRSRDYVHWPPVQHLLLGSSEAWPGSRPPPCALVTSGPPRPELADPDVVQRLVRAIDHVAVIDGPWPVGPDASLVLYLTADGACPTTMSQRYVDLPQERDLRPLFGALPCGEVRELPSRDDTRRFGAVVELLEPHPDRCTPLVLGVELSPAEGGVAVRLDAPQLRGIADNGGWFAPGAIRAPTLVLSNGERTRRVPLLDGLLGYLGPATPVFAGAELEPGTWSARLVGEVIDLPSSHGERHGTDSAWRHESLVAHAFTLHLTDTLVVGR